MIGKIPYLLLAVFLLSCNSRWSKRLTLWRNDKIAYGTYYAYNNLQYMFRSAEIETSNTSPVAFYQSNDSAAAFMVIGESLRPDEDELRALLHHAYSGNTVFISAVNVGKNLLDSLRVEVSDQQYGFKGDSLSTSILDPSNYDSLVFSYPGYALDNYFTDMDSSITEVLGKDGSGKANFIRFTYVGGGSILLHLAPTAFSNFFLLHKQNKKYYDLAVSYIPANSDKVRWDDYFRHHTDGKDESERSGFSKLKAFLDHDVLRWALWLAVILFALIYLIESKRKQRAIPVRAPLNNASLDFVRTIGRLYYQRRDNKNLASKMATHFLGHVRSRYNIATADLGADFEKKLSYKSGYSEEFLHQIVAYIRNIETSGSVSDAELLSFHQLLDKFYKQT